MLWLKLKPELREGEVVLGEYGATLYLVGKWMVESGNRRLWLTNQRLILRAGLPPQRTWPLYTLANIREEKLIGYTAIRLEFANGRVEWLTVEKQAQFLEALRSAQASAPVIPEEASRPTVHPFFLASFGATLVCLGMTAICILIGVGLITMVGVVMSLAQGG